jgi:hypothetical protein
MKGPIFQGQYEVTTLQTPPCGHVVPETPETLSYALSVRKRNKKIAKEKKEKNKKALLAYLITLLA